MKNIQLPLPAPLLTEEELLRLMSLIRNSRNIVILAHHGPDGDAVGSALGWQGYLRRLGKRTNIVVPNAYPDFLRWLPDAPTIIAHHDRPKQAAELLRNADLIFCLDLNEPKRLQQTADLLPSEKQAPRVMIDHHLNPDTASFQMVISHPEMSSTSELVFRLLCQLGAYDDLTLRQATCLYTGMMTDTGAFTYNSAQPEIFLIVALLLQKGIDKDDIYKRVYHSWSENRLRLWSHVLSDCLTFHSEQHASIFTLTRADMKAYRFIRGDAEGLVNEPLKVRGMRLSIALREDTEKEVIRVSLRSAGGFHCREMAERFFNGGGHADAAGGELPFPIEDAVKTAEAAIQAYTGQLAASE